MPMKKVILIVFLSLLQNLVFSQTYTLVIDAGHGGKDPGRERGSKTRLHEKSLNLSVALKLGEYIKKNLPNVTVLYTRTTDVFLSLEERIDFAHNNNADFFMSIHCNSSPKQYVNGFEVHVHTEEQKASLLWAKLLIDDMKNRAGRPSRGIKDLEKRGHNLYVVQRAKIPSILVECGFMTNPTEEKYLNSDYGQTLIASSLFRSFRTFIQQKIPSENRKAIYKVQILASKTQISKEASVFKKLDMSISEKVFPDSEYKYKYYVGWEFDEKKAQQLARKVADKGFKGAFVVEMN